MSGDLTAKEENYSSRLFQTILNAVITMDAAPGSDAGIVRPDLVREVLVDVAATIDFNAGLGDVPSARHRAGGALGKRYVMLLKSLIENRPGDWAPAVRLDTTARP